MSSNSQDEFHSAKKILLIAIFVSNRKTENVKEPKFNTCFSSQSYEQQY